MNTYFIHDGRNEVGPFSIDLLKQQKLTRNTPIRQKDTDKWMPAERLAELKPLVAPRKIRRPKDIVPAVREHADYYRRTRPLAFYSLLIIVPLVAGVSVYTASRASAPPLTAQITTQRAAPAAKPESVMPAATTADTSTVVKAPIVAADPARSTRQRWNKLITVSGSNYGIGLLGGIKDLAVTVRNRSEYPIDEAIVKVTYIKASGEVWKSTMVSVKNIPARDVKEEPVNDVGRGKKVKVTLYKVISRKMNFQYTEGQRGGDVSDPYYKK